MAIFQDDTVEIHQAQIIKEWKERQLLVNVDSTRTGCGPDLGTTLCCCLGSEGT